MTTKEYLEGFVGYIYDSGIINGEQHDEVFKMIGDYLNDIHSEMAEYRASKNTPPEHFENEENDMNSW